MDGLTPTLVVTPYGDAARRALAAAIDHAKQTDPFAPVTVVVPSALAAATLRRRLANDGVGGANGVVGVSFVALPELAERLAAPMLAASGRRPLGPLEAFAIAGRVLSDDPGPLAASAAHPATVDACLATFADLRGVTDGELAAVASRSGRANAVVRLFRAYQRATAGWADEYDVLTAAAEAVRVGGSLVDEIGTVVTYLPRRLGRAELVLLGAWADGGRLVAIVGRTGHALADEATEELIGQLKVTGLQPADRTTGPQRDPTGTSIVRAPDPAEEARAAVRTVVAALGDGVAPERIAIVSRVRDPYTLLAHEELAAAGIAHSAPSATRLTQSLAGRTLLGLVAWPAAGYRRDDLMRVLRGAPVRDPAGGMSTQLTVIGSLRSRVTPVASMVHPHGWDRLARDAGVVAGLDQWRARLATARVVHVARAAAQREAGDEEPRAQHRVEDLDRLMAFVERLAVDVEPPATSGWASLAMWAKGLVSTYLGGDVTAASWPEPEQRSRAAVLELLDQLAALEGSPSTSDFYRILAHHLDRPAGRVGRFGQGVFIGRLVDVVGADLDLLIVLGAAEGVFPPPPADDALLPLRERAAAGPALRRRGPTRAEEERDALAALAAAEKRVVTFPVADPRGQRARQPAPWLLERCRELAGRRVTTDSIATLAADEATADWFHDLASFEWWLGSGAVPATPTEFDVAAMLEAHRAAADPRELLTLPTVEVAGLRRGLEAATARARGELSIWTGAVGAHPELADDLSHPRSPTSLQEWATCPFRYYMGRVLGVRPLEDPADVETIAATDRGTLVHAVLEQFIADRRERLPGSAWSAEDRAAFLAIADEVEAAFRQAGRTGRAVLWRAEWDALRRHLIRILDADESDPRLAGVSPVAVELAFGDEGEGLPVEVTLPSGRTVRFHGRIDRVDRSPDGRRLVVLDYKTGGANEYQVLDPNHKNHDIVARGRLLQLPIYALAAGQAYPGADLVEAYYWFVGSQGTMEMKGGPIDEAADRRFREVLATIAEGIEGGHFPARPGEERWYPGRGPTYDNCAYCAFDRVCSAGRAEQWVELRGHPELQSYVALAEGDNGNGNGNGGGSAP